MRYFKTKPFHRWANKEGISEDLLIKAVDEITSGLVDANLGGGLYKKRLPLEGQGKSGGFRTLLGYKSKTRSFFLLGFAKNDQGNINTRQKEALKIIVKSYMDKTDQEIEADLNGGQLIEMEVENEE